MALWLFNLYKGISQTCIKLQSIVSLITKGQYLVQRSNLERPVKEKNISQLLLLFHALIGQQCQFRKLCDVQQFFVDLKMYESETMNILTVVKTFKNDCMSKF